jgi:hypothetical protein
MKHITLDPGEVVLVASLPEYLQPRVASAAIHDADAVDEGRLAQGEDEVLVVSDPSDR